MCIWYFLYLTDSVVIMLGCVAGFLLLFLNIWMCLSCIRLPRKRRYVMAVIVSNASGEHVFKCFILIN